MTITLELRPEEVAALQNRALAEDIDIETLLHRLIAQSASPSAPQAWREKDETDDPEEQAEREREMEELKANLLRWRAEEGQ